MVDEPAAPSDALIVLGDDNYAGDRAFHAAELYREGVAPVVVASGRMLRQNVSIADMMAARPGIVRRARRIDREAGAPGRKHAGRGGRSRAPHSSPRMEARPDRHLQLSCPPRALHLWNDSAAERQRFASAARAILEFDPSRWWETRQGQKLFMTELLGYLVARWELRGESGGGKRLGIPDFARTNSDGQSGCT